MTNYKQSLESSILKERLNRLMESLEKTNTSKMILERYYANICTLEISEGTSTSREVQKELNELGLNESKIISAVSSSVVPERKGVSDHFAIQKIALLENLSKELNPYSWMKSVSTFIAETADFLRENELPILLERVVFDLENDRNSNYYKKAIDTISEASISENPIYAILENTKDQKWIPLVKRLHEYCETKKGNVNGTNPNFKVSKIYSPIEFIEERGSYIFNANGKTFETDGDTIMEFEFPTSDKFKSLLAITEKSKFDNGVMRLYPNVNSTLDINFNEEKPKVFINSKIVESSSVESHLVVGGYVKYSDKETISQIQQAIHEGNNIKELDFGYTVTSKLYETVSVSVFSLGENVYIQKVNKGMKENTLTKAESAEEAVAIVKEFMNYDITNSIKHLTEAEEARKMSKEKEISKQLDYLNSVYEKETETIRTRIKTLTESLNHLDRVARLNGVENTSKIVQAKSLLESQITKAKEALETQESLIKNESEKIANTEEVNESALEIAGGIILGILGIKAIAATFKTVLGVVALKSVRDPKKLKEVASQLATDAMSKGGKNPLQVALWKNTVDQMIETKEISNAFELAKTFKGMDKIDIKKVFEDEGFDLSDDLNENCQPGKEYKIGGEAGWIYQGVADGVHIFNNEKGGFDPKNYTDEEFAKAHKTGEITECGSM